MTTQKPPEGEHAPAKSAPKRKDAERLANALRDNLRRRKEQAKARQGGKTDPESI